jgi:hypothetical protein
MAGNLPRRVHRYEGAMLLMMIAILNDIVLMMVEMAMIPRCWTILTAIHRYLLASCLMPMQTSIGQSHVLELSGRDDKAVPDSRDTSRTESRLLLQHTP